MQWLALILGVLTLSVAGLMAWQWGRRGPASVENDDPRLTFTTPYLNIRPDVRYVGSERCVDCHADYAESYFRHPMGHSLVPIARVPPRERAGTAGRDTFTASGFEFHVERRGDRVVHREVKRDAQGHERAELEGEVRYALGSGARGYAFLVERDGFLFQSPISWYSQQGVWDLSPGYARNLRHFERPIRPECVACHSGRANPIEGTVNRYHQPAFAEAAIGCERCHGPGELHVRQRQDFEPVTGRDVSIVNPRDLAPALRDAVCEQCHLTGEIRVPRVGRTPADYRPGLPLELFLSTFVKAPEHADEARPVGHVEQMHASRCYQATEARLGCISCHDAHALPPEASKPAYYRKRCLACHREQGCRLPPGERQARGDDCTACHMPRFASLAHVATTDHRILRRPPPAAPRAEAARDPGEGRIVNFYGDRLTADDPEAGRALAIALMGTYTPRSGPEAGRTALPLLEAAVRRRPDDRDAREALGRALGLVGRNGEALAAFEACLEERPEWESVLQSAANLCTQSGQLDKALAYWRRTLAMNPWSSATHFEVARILAAREQWTDAALACKKALELNPTHREARQLLITCFARQGDWTQADQELETAIVFAPDNAVELRRWFGGLAR